MMIYRNEGKDCLNKIKMKDEREETPERPLFVGVLDLSSFAR